MYSTLVLINGALKTQINAKYKQKEVSYEISLIFFLILIQCMCTLIN